MFSQITGSLFDDAKTMFEIFEKRGFPTKKDIEDYLKKYGFEEMKLD